MLNISWVNTFNRRIKKVLTFDQLPGHYTSHCLRHTFAITSMLLGMRIEIISDLLGHSNLQTTQVYARVVNEIRETQMDVWDDFFKDRDTMQRVHCGSCGTKIMEYPIGSLPQDSLTVSCPKCMQSNTHLVVQVASRAA